MLRPTRDQLLVEDVPEEENISEGGIALMSKRTILVNCTVLAVGKDVEEIKVGDTVVVLGVKSGIDVGNGTRIISEEICVAIEKEE